mgnify:CR=1 FL=1
MQVYQEKLDSLLARRSLVLSQIRAEKKALRRAEAKVGSALKAQQLVQEVAEAVQHKAHQRIAGVVTRCLRAVFGDEAYEFRIDFSKKRGKTEAKLLFVRDGHEIDPVDASGGGVIDVASTGLRLASLMLSQPKKRRLLVLDEPFRFVSVEYRPAITRLIVSLAREMKIQFVIVTHSKELMMGKVFEL